MDVPNPKTGFSPISGKGAVFTKSEFPFLMSPSKPPRVLVIDDEASLRTVFTFALSSDGFEAEAANGPQESVARMRSFQPELIIIDLKMPLMGGIEMVKLLRTEGYESSFAICSAFIAQDVLFEAFSLGVVDFISKPTTPENLRAVAKRIFTAHGGSFDDTFEEVRHRIRLQDIQGARAVCERSLKEGKDERLEALLELFDYQREEELENGSSIDISDLLL